MHRILLAEDDDAIVRLLTDFLREEGFAVTAAAGERSAREALERERFDLLWWTCSWRTAPASACAPPPGPGSCR